MKFFLTTIVFIILTNCSFDNKTGIWQNNEIENKNLKKNQFENFKVINTKIKTFNKEIDPPINLNILVNSIKFNTNWPDEYYGKTNNTDNFSYKDLNELVFKSKKLSKFPIKDRFIFNEDKVITVDTKGNIIVYSLEKQKIILRYNFYKKKYKKIKKKLNLISEKNIIYISDNFGYLYSINLIENKLVWAKNYKIPFKSNFKIFDNKIILSDINNSLYFIDKLTGNKKKFVPTEETLIKNNFVNSLALNDNNIFYLNTFGSLYSFDKNLSINWFLNLNQSVDVSASGLFYSNPLVLYEDKIIVSTDPYLYILNANNGSTIHKISITSKTTPIISGKSIFLITNDNLLICLNMTNGKVIYSIDISKKIGELLETKNKPIIIKSLSIINNNLYIFLKNSYLVKFNINGLIQNISKFSNKLSSFPIFINDSIIYISKKNKLVILN